MPDLPEIRLRKGRAEYMLNQIARQLDVTVEKDCRRSQLAIPTGYGGGEVIVYSNMSGMDALLFDLPGRVSWRLTVDEQSAEPLTFFTVCSGVIEATSPTESFRISALQCAIHGGFNGESHHYHLAGDEGMVLMMTFVYKQEFFDGMDCASLRVPEDLLVVIEDLENAKPHFLFSDIFHLPIINAVQDILAQKDLGLLNSSFAAAKVHEALFLQIHEYKNHTENSSRRIVRHHEKIQLIRDAEQILISRLKNPPTIPELSRMVGLNQQTLKQGFRQLYGKSINQYLNNKRLEQAGILIRAGELSLREVSLEIGYNNPGYFSRRFREKYGVTPRYFSQARGTE